MLVRGISDTPWFPDAYDAALAADRAAAVVAYLVARLPAAVSKAPVTMANLSPVANEAAFGTRCAVAILSYVVGVGVGSAVALSWRIGPAPTVRGPAPDGSAKPST
jgi:adenosylhomocysteine nucleosidase